MEFLDYSCDDFLRALASKAATPGGGGACALVGAVGMALGHMVGALTTGKKKYAGVQEDIEALMERASGIQSRLRALVEEDAKAFEPLSKAYGLPKDTEEQREYKAAVMEQALDAACAVPIKIMEECCAALEVLREFAAKGSALAISDAGVGAACCRAALMGASLNVFINTKAMADGEKAAALNARANSMLKEYIPLADDVFDNVASKLV